MNKVIVKFLIISLLISIMSVFCFASSGEGYTFYYENGREIIVLNPSLTYEEQKAIADYVAYGIQPCEHSLEQGNTINTPLLCILFGHNLATTSVLEITHNVYTTSPKCVENEYTCTYCTRDSCDYIVKELIYSGRTAICHG